MRRVFLIFVATASAAGFLAAGSHGLHYPLILPPLGATAYLFFVKPDVPASSPRNAILGHLFGVVCGVAALAICGLETLPPDIALEMDWPRVAACAIALGTTCAGMFMFGIDHPPAGATTLIVAFGVCPYGIGPVTFMGGVVLLTAFAFAVNRLRGFVYPLWSAPKKFHPA